MIYAFEILIALALLLASFLIYRALINSPRFTRFLDRTFGKGADLGDAAAHLDDAEDQAERTAYEAAQKIKRDAAALRSLNRRRGS